MDEYNVTMTL